MFLSMIHRMCESDQTKRRGVFTAEVLSNRNLCPEHLWITLRMKGGFPSTEAGQFVQVQCRPLDAPAGPTAVEWPDDGPPVLTQAELTGSEPLLRRPLSLAGRRDVSGGVELDIIYRVVGSGTGFLSRLSAGDVVSVLGPLGNAFPISDSKPKAVLVGGGVGIPPMLYLAETLGRVGKETVAFCGARSGHLLPVSADDFAQRGAKQIVATDDGTLGVHGLVTDALLHWLHEQPSDSGGLVVYACGPEPMMRSVGDLCLDRGIECYLSLERIMACGMGTCQSCAVKVHDESADAGWRYKLCCSDGPVFPADVLIWE